MRSNVMRLSALALVVTLSSGIAADEKAAEQDIVEIAAGNKMFTKLVAALKAADLVDTLKGPGPFTVFAPTDKAFEALGEETLAAVLADKKKLTAILTYHVVAGKVPAKAAIGLATDEKSAKTVNGAEIKLTMSGKSLKINDATVIKADIMAKNGVIHVIDKVIMPPK